MRTHAYYLPPRKSAVRIRSPGARLIDGPEFKGKLTVNGHGIVKIYLDTVALGAQGYMKYRTIYVYPQVDKQIDIAIQNIASGQMAAAEAMRKAQQNSLAELQRAGIKL